MFDLIKYLSGPNVFFIIILKKIFLKISGQVNNLCKKTVKNNLSLIIIEINIGSSYAHIFFTYDPTYA